MMKIIRTRTKSGNVFGGCILAMVLMIGFLASIPVYAQVVGATLSGTITDESGGLMVSQGCDEINLLHSEGPRVYKVPIREIKTEIPV
jgi:hypothetical protein